MKSHIIHAFNVSTAMAFGLEEATIIHQFMYWIEKNEVNNVNFYDGHYWTYNSLLNLKKLFPYMSFSTIRRKIENLKEKGVLIVGRHNKAWSNQTNWYTIDMSKLTNAYAQIEQLTDVQSEQLTDAQSEPMYNSSNTTSDTVVGEPDVLETKHLVSIIKESCFDTVYAKYPRKMGRKAALRHFLASVKSQQDLLDISQALDNYNDYILKNKIEMQFTQMASTWFNNWKDWLNHKPVEIKPKSGAAGREL